MTQTYKPRQFELRRQSDGVVYRFAETTAANGRVGYKRRDADHWIIWHDTLRWIAGTWDNDAVYGRPWDQLSNQTPAGPPEGVWVSRKGTKSYVYDLVYVECDIGRSAGATGGH